jgi:hypothetical protein
MCSRNCLSVIWNKYCLSELLASTRHSRWIKFKPRGLFLPSPKPNSFWTCCYKLIRIIWIKLDIKMIVFKSGIHLARNKKAGICWSLLSLVSVNRPFPKANCLLLCASLIFFNSWHCEYINAIRRYIEWLCSWRMGIKDCLSRGSFFCIPYNQHTVGSLISSYNYILFRIVSSASYLITLIMLT